MKKRILAMLLALVMVLGLAPTAALAADGESLNPDVVIATVEDFITFANAVNNGKTYEGELIALTVNLDLEGSAAKPWTPIGSSSSKCFKGTFDGGYHSIEGLYVNATTAYQGLFGYMGNTGTIRNLTVKGSVSVSLSGANGHSAGILGYNNGGTVENCANYVNVSVTYSGSGYGGAYYNGCVVGYNSGTVANCANYGTLNGYQALGGIVGQNYSGTVRNCYNMGAVTATGTQVGGIVGYAYAGSITSCYNAGALSAKSTVNGIQGVQKGSGNHSNNYYLEGTATGDTATGESKTSDELKALASTLGDAFAANPDGYPVLAWEKNIDTRDPVKAQPPAPPAVEFDEASEMSARLSGYIKGAINARKAVDDPESKGVLKVLGAAVNPNGGASVASSTYNDWIAFTIGRFGLMGDDGVTFLYGDGSGEGYEDYLKSAADYVTEKYEDTNKLLDKNKATEWHRLTYAVLALGGDPTQFGKDTEGTPVDLINDGTYNRANPGRQGING